MQSFTAVPESADDASLSPDAHMSNKNVLALTKMSDSIEYQKTIDCSGNKAQSIESTEMVRQPNDSSSDVLSADCTSHFQSRVLASTSNGSDLSTVTRGLRCVSNKSSENVIGNRPTVEQPWNKVVHNKVKQDRNPKLGKSKTSVVSGESPTSDKSVSYSQALKQKVDPQHSASKPDLKSNTGIVKPKSKSKSTLVPVGTGGNELCDEKRAWFHLFKSKLERRWRKLKNF